MHYELNENGLLKNKHSWYKVYVCAWKDAGNISRNTYKKDTSFYRVSCVLLFLMFTCQQKSPGQNSTLAGKSDAIKHLTINAGQQFQMIDGFGVNITPAQWQKGKLKPVIDSLVDDLGCTLIRFDCYGRADWLDPARQNADGRFPEEYLREVYTSPVFKDAWETFRYFNTKGIEPVFNISGAIPPGWATMKRGKLQGLKDFNGYSEMAASLLKWARDKEKLKFSLFMPFNETDLGFPEGPVIEKEDCFRAYATMMDKLKMNGFENLQLVIMDDANLVPERLDAIVNDPNYVSRVKGFGWHTYGNGNDMDAQGGWFMGTSDYGKFINRVNQSVYKNKSFWLTEYGDLDQSEEIEFEFAWRSTRRLIKSLNDGMTGAIAWDAFDNYHVHDSAWALYGLLKTDTINWTYQAKPRYYAARQLYKFIKPGFIRCSVGQQRPGGIFAVWKMPLKNMYLSAFVSASKDEFTLTGISMVEADTKLDITLKDFSGVVKGKKVYYYRTSRNENCVKAGEITIHGNSLNFTVPERSIFTITTVKGE